MKKSKIAVTWTVGPADKITRERVAGLPLGAVVRCGSEVLFILRQLVMQRDPELVLVPQGGRNLYVLQMPGPDRR